jgi:hypothetical protein
VGDDSSCWHRRVRSHNAGLVRTMMATLGPAMAASKLGIPIDRPHHTYEGLVSHSWGLT